MKDIDKIIEKYFDGESSLQEEEILRNYFLQSDIEDRHKIYAPMFNFFGEERQAIEPQKEVKEKRKKKKLPLYTWAGIAAGILLIIGIRFAYTPFTHESTQSMVYIDGKKVSDAHTINSQAIISIKNISEMDADAFDSQIGILDSFTD